MDINTANSMTGGLSNTKKMPCKSYGLPAKECGVGSMLRKVNGSVCSNCYAMRGHYQYPNVQAAQYKRLASITNPDWVNAMVLLIKESARQMPQFEKYFRWHDSGDIQNIEHLGKIIAVCWKTPEIKHWIPTKEKAIINSWRVLYGEFPHNVIIRLSAPLMDASSNDCFSEILTSTVTTKDEPITAQSFLCPANNNGNRCGDCRNCWDSNIHDITYHAQ